VSNIVNNTTTNWIPPTPTNPTFHCTPAKVSFNFDAFLEQAKAFDASLNPALAITPGMVMQNNLDKDNTINSMGTVKTGGTHGTTTDLTEGNDYHIKSKLDHVNLEDMTTYNAFIPKVSPTSPFSKVCFEVGSGTNLVMAAQTSTQMLESLYGVGVNMSPETHVQTLGEQLAPFPLLAVMHPGNKIVILHGLQHFTVLFGQHHMYKGDTVAFFNDSTDGESLPPIVKLSHMDFQEAKAWFCPDIQVVMDTNHTMFETIPVPDYNSIVITSKIIPIPLLLVPLFPNGGNALNVVGAFHMFVDEFYESAPEELKAAMQYIHDYLLEAVGHYDAADIYGQGGSTRSQLACTMVIIPMDPAVLADWAMTQYGGILHQADKFDKSKALAQQEVNQG